MNTSVTALIATRSRELRDALQALLESMTYFHTVYQTSNAQTSIASLKAYCPAVTLCDYVIFNEVSGWSNTQLLVLVDTRVERDLALAKGASHVVITGTPVEHLITMINAMLNPDGGSANDD